MMQGIAGALIAAAMMAQPYGGAPIDYMFAPGSMGRSPIEPKKKRGKPGSQTRKQIDRANKSNRNAAAVARDDRKAAKQANHAARVAGRHTFNEVECQEGTAGT